MECGLSTHLSPRAQDLAIRVTGIVLASIGALAIAALYRMVHTTPSRAAAYIECSLAALGFIGLSLGSLLLALGSHISDQIEI